MGQSISIPFDQFANAMVALNTLNSPSGLHGWLAGYLSTGARLSPSQWQKEAQDYLEVEEDFSKPIQSLMIVFYGWVLNDLSSESMRFDLFLPEEDDCEVSQKITALAQWCKGFLDGFGAAGKKEEQITEEVMEVLKHFDAFSYAEQGEEDDEEGEKILWELREHAKVAALTVFIVFNNEADAQGKFKKSDLLDAMAVDPDDTIH
jgi:uncharacterized protein YgfB (UPF0149 family)